MGSDDKSVLSRGLCFSWRHQAHQAGPALGAGPATGPSASWHFLVKLGRTSDQAVCKARHPALVCTFAQGGVNIEPSPRRVRTTSKNLPNGQNILDPKWGWCLMDPSLCSQGPTFTEDSRVVLLREALQVGE